MTRFLEFVANHWMLWGAFVSILTALVVTELRRRGSGAEPVGPLEASRLMSHEDAVVLDVREDSEYRQGHIANAVHIPLSQLENRLDELKKYEGRPLVLCCRSGNRSGKAARLLRKHGFGTVKDLAGGMLAWENAQLPVVRK